LAYQPLEKLLPRANNSRYRLVMLAARRAKELADGQPKLIDNVVTDKVATIALREIIEGKVFVSGFGPESAQKAKTSAKKE